MEDQKNIEFLITLGWVGMTILAAGIIIFFVVHRKKMIKIDYEKRMEVLKSAVIAEEKLKDKIAKNLHDDILSKLSAISSSLDKNLIDFNKNKFDTERLQKDIIVLDDIITEVRGISYDLMPPVLSRLGLIQALNHFIDQISETANSFAKFEDKTAGAEIFFNQVDQLSIYRICLELINNLMKHSGYEFLKLSIEKQESNLLIEFQHDGKGLVNEDIEAFSHSSKGLGLNSIKSRAILLNASINYFRIDDLYYVHVEIPYAK